MNYKKILISTFTIFLFVSLMFSQDKRNVEPSISIRYDDILNGMTPTSTIGIILGIDEDKYTVKNISENHEVSKMIEQIQYSLEQIEKSGYDHFMLKEIFEQSKSIQESMRGRIDIDDYTVKLGGINDWMDRIINARQLYITACGTSWHAALIGSYILEELLNIPVKVEYASEFRYQETAVNGDSVVICVSQSGETADTLAAIRKAKTKGALTLGIVNVVGSSIARETHCGVYIHAGPEIGVASTKAFTAQVTVFNLIGLLLAQKKSIQKDVMQTLINDLDSLPNLVQSVLDHGNDIISIAQDFTDVDNFLYLGRGYQFPVALEGALKLKEISYIHAEAYAAGELKHGPLALVDDDMPVVAVAPDDDLLEKLKSNLHEVDARGGQLFVFADPRVQFGDRVGIQTMHMPAAIEDFQAPILYTIPLQLLAYHVAVLKGTDVDQPRNLAKSVTVEEFRKPNQKRNKNGKPTHERRDNYCFCWNSIS